MIHLLGMEDREKDRLPVVLFSPEQNRTEQRSVPNNRSRHCSHRPDSSFQLNILFDRSFSSQSERAGEREKKSRLTFARVSLGGRPLLFPKTFLIELLGRRCNHGASLCTFDIASTL